jgi:hypothetical protein
MQPDRPRTTANSFLDSSEIHSRLTSPQYLKLKYNSYQSGQGLENQKNQKNLLKNQKKVLKNQKKVLKKKNYNLQK